MTERKLKTLADIVNALAKIDCKGADRKLLCMTCGNGEPITEEQVAKSIRSGWKKCCGKTMELI